LDIEAIGAAIPFSRAVFSEQELGQLPDASPENAVWAWSAKEAVGKLTGFGLREARMIRVPLRGSEQWSEAVAATGAPGVVRRVTVSSPHIVTLAAPEPANVRLEDWSTDFASGS